MTDRPTRATASERIAAGRTKHAVGDSDYLPGNVCHLVSPVIGRLRLDQRDGRTPDYDWMIDRLSLVLDMSRAEAERDLSPDLNGATHD